MIKNATDVVVQSIVDDPVRLQDIVDIVRNTPIDKTEAVKNYCGRSLRRGLIVEEQVVDTILEGASWEEVTERISAISQKQ